MLTQTITLNHARTTAVVHVQNKAAAFTGFTGEFLDSFFVAEGDKLNLYIGSGDKELPLLQWQEIYALAASTMQQHKIDRYDVDISPIVTALGHEGIVHAVHGLVLGTYNFKIKQEKKVSTINLLLEGATEEAEAKLAEALSLAEAVVMARDLINLPSNYLHPMDFAKSVSETLTPLGVECEIIEADRLKEMGMNGLYLIGDSSDFKPALLVMRYLPLGKDADRLGLVGKGVTYDSGGYSLKSSPGMMGMKSDMAGAASVAATVYALAKNSTATNVVAVAPLCENRVSGSAMVPGDVYTSYSGKTVEVLNTDAEGRLVLADAVSYIQKDEGVSRIVDIATLTGAVGSALGNGVTGVVTNDKDWWSKVEEASAVSGERLHLLPDYPEYHKMLDSNIADVKNIGDTFAGAITGGLFIGRFTEETPWVHLDIAATSWMTSPLFRFQAKGGTGCGIMTLYALCKNESL